MATSTMMKYPGEPIYDLKSVPNSLLIAGASQEIKYKAYLSSHICSDPDRFAVDSSVFAADAEHFFSRAARHLQQKLFGMNAP